jgi:EmrB/QacA subfamily drug resistance transporter
MDTLSASLDDILWVLNAYILVYAVLLITSGRLGDMYGQRNLFIGGMATFVLASAYCGLAPDINHLIAGRVIQGIGGALLTPQTMAILTTIFPPERRGAAFGVWGAVAGVAAVTGPTLGGFIVTDLSWRWIFYVNLPIGLLSLTAAFLVIPDIRPGRRHSLDPVGVVLASVGLLGIVFGLIEGQHFDWGVVWGFLTILEIIGVGLVIIIGFMVWEWFQKEPLVPLSLFRDRNYSLMNATSALMSFGMFGLILPFTIYLQSVLGLSALNAGLTMAPMALVSMFVAPITGRLADRIGGKFILMVGLTLFALAMGLLTRIASPESTWSVFLLPLILAGVAQGSIFAPQSSIAMRHITPRMAGAASGVLNTTRQLGSVIGSAAIGALLQNQLASGLRSEAVTYAAQVPSQFQERFIGAIGSAASGALEVGPTQNAGVQLPADIPTQVAAQLEQFFRAVFSHGFIDAMQSTVWLPIGVLLAGAAVCVLVENQQKAAARAAAEEKVQTVPGTNRADQEAAG